MLVTRRGEFYACVTQYDHGALAGTLAEQWGNEWFAPPVLAASLQIAAAHHDDGWRELDDLPAYNEEVGRPAHFLELPLERTAPPYGRGVDSVYRRDPLAGALVGMHWTGLYSGRWGLQSSGGPLLKPLAQQVVEEQEERRVETLRKVWDFKGLRSSFEGHVWYAYEVLQALDVLSLALSLTDPAVPTDRRAEPLSITDVLFAVEQPPGSRILPTVPSGPLQMHRDLTLAVTTPGEALIDPWPFTSDDFAVELPARHLAEDGLSAAESAEAYGKAPVDKIRWRLVPR